MSPCSVLARWDCVAGVPLRATSVPQAFCTDLPSFPRSQGHSSIVLLSLQSLVRWKNDSLCSHGQGDNIQQNYYSVKVTMCFSSASKQAFAPFRGGRCSSHDF